MEIKEMAPLNPTALLPQKFTHEAIESKQINLSNRNKQEQPPKMERQRNNYQSKGKEESPESVLNEIEASKL